MVQPKLDSVRKARILEPRVVQPIQIPQGRQRFWSRDWCNPYAFLRKCKDSAAQSGATLKKTKNAGAQNGATHIHSLRKARILEARLVKAISIS